MNIGQTSVTISAAVNSYVCLSMGGTIYGVGTVGSTGSLTMTITPFTSAGTADLVVTGQNKVSYIGTVTIALSYAPPQNLTFVAQNSKVVLNWSAPVSGTPAYYKVYRNGTLLASNITGLTYTNTGLTNGTPYSYYVTAYYTSPSATESDASNTVSATPIAAPPTSLTATAGSLQVSLNWTAPTTETPDGYLVYRNGSSITPTAITGTTYLDTGVINDLTYSYYVVAVYNTPYAVSAASNTASATPNSNITVYVGTETTANRYPIASYMGYERSASLYLYSEIGTYGTVRNVSWKPTVTTSTNVPVKVYLRIFPSSATTLTSTKWATILTDATLVYNGTLSGTTANEWKMIDITDYSYLSGNLLVLVESNYGSTGDGGATTGAGYTYSVTTGNNRSQTWGKNSTEPLTNGTLTTSRPNIRLMMNTDPVFVINQSSLDFGSVALGQTSTRQFTLSNTGIQTLTGNITTPAGYIVAPAAKNTLSYSIPSGSNVTYTVTFSPTEVQTYSGNIMITSNDPAHSSTNVAVTGSGYTYPQITVNKSSLSTSLIPNATGSDNIQVGNLGSTSLTYSVNISYGSRDLSWLSVSPTSGTITGSGSTQLNVGYNTAGLAAGNYTASIVISSNDPVNPTKTVTVALEVLSVNHTPTIDLPVSFSFDKNGTLPEDFSSYVNDADADQLNLTAIGYSHIHVAITGLNVTFTADENWVGTENITFSVDDGYRVSASDQVAVTVNPLNVPAWSPVVYPNQHAVIYATVTIDDVTAEPGDIIAAFVQNECRGTAVLQNNKSATATLTVNVAQDGEELHFKLYDVSSDEVFEAENTVTVNIGETLGTPEAEIPVDIITTVGIPSQMALQKQDMNMTVNWAVVPNANTYHVYRSESLSGSYSKIADVHTNSYVDSTASGRVYFYYVTAERVNNK
ncbi:MAG TPA: choice-of-anchor D domain-containing protein [Candidatus Cloacimonadota bacterium]|nr:choice-of-anchor D domain-containing protein [Candidatus Cloacimonadota bacterium]